ncbi:MAG: TlpA disulfide reductase family protein [Candidatus Pseudobacter hemicellulosilyticus]|uniref:TlpA disulfide reductase family protein n=1 Tax=Candidatus Pseudobacter hemicellulosilyticus TaxID=3121375 RepID=A0AAJ5WM67_9BACT|nr:MAG: TlpA disulfide reductase family protein [Pseudobacter sp.]
MHYACRLCFVLFVGWIAPAVYGQSGFQVTVVCPSIQEDSLFLSMKDAFSREQGSWTGARAEAGGIYHFKVQTTRAYGYFSLLEESPAGYAYADQYRAIPFLIDYCWQAGDSITILVDRRYPDKPRTYHEPYDFTRSFSGTGAAKLRLKEALQHAADTRTGPERPFWEDSTQRSHYDPNLVKLQACLLVLDQYRDSVPDFIYQLHRAKIVTTCYSIGSYFYRLRLGYAATVGKPAARARFLDAYRMSMAARYSLAVDSNWLPASNSYLHFLYGKINFENYLRTGTDDPDADLKTIAAGYSGALRDRLLLQVIRADKGTRHFDTLYDWVARMAKDPYTRKELAAIRGRLPGQPAFEFALPDTNGTIHRLADYKGRTIMVDVWFTGCGACEYVYKNVLKPAKELLQDHKDILFLSICIDTGKKTWLKSIRSGSYTSAKALNLYTAGKGSDQELLRYYGINAYPTLFIIRPDGTMHRFYENRTAADLASPEILAEVLKATAGAGAHALAQ